MHKLSIALAKGAMITVDWIQSIVVKAKKSWNVKSPDSLEQHLATLLKDRGLEFHPDMGKILKNCWSGIPS